MRKVISILITITILFTFATVQCGTVAFGNTDLDIKGKAAMVYCATTDQVIFEKNPDERMYVASIMKLVTAMLTVENIGLDTAVTVDEQATQVVPFNLPVYEGEKLTSGDLLHATLMKSSNDATEALGIAIGGSQDKFTQMMQEKVAKLGCKNTNPVSASGVNDKKEYSTARDVITIAKAAFSDESIIKICQTTSYEFPKVEGKEDRKITNGNPFIKGGVGYNSKGKVDNMEYSGVFAGKTGTNDNGDASMVVGYSLDGLELYVVTLQSTKDERYNDIKKLLDYGVSKVPRQVAIKKGQSLGNAKIWNGETNKVTGVSAKEGTLVLPKGISKSLISTEVIYDSKLKAPIKKGDKIGTVNIYLAGEKVSSVDVLSNDDVKKGWPLSKYRITNTQTIIICAVLGVVLFFVLVILILRALNRAKRKKARRRKLKRLAALELAKEQDNKKRNWKI